LSSADSKLFLVYLVEYMFNVSLSVNEKYVEKDVRKIIFFGIVLKQRLAVVLVDETNG